jgi:hypothetical protein
MEPIIPLIVLAILLDSIGKIPYNIILFIVREVRKKRL